MAGWVGRRVVIVGLARQGKALARYLGERGAEVIVSDLKSAEELAPAREELADLPLRYALGGHSPDILEGADLLCLSGGVAADLPLAQQARLRGIPLSNDSQLFLEACTAPVVGITGSAGKTTTTELVGRMARAAVGEPVDGERAAPTPTGPSGLAPKSAAIPGPAADRLEPGPAGRANSPGMPSRRVWVGGNIGLPLLEWADRIGPQDIVVLELSSFQLELMTRSPQVAALLNLTPNHLDRHHSLEAYTAAKRRILDFQSASDVAVLGRDDPGAWALRKRVRGRLLTFGLEPGEGDGTFVADGRVRLRQGGRDQELLPVGAIELRGAHNRLNVLAACAVAAAMGLPPEAMPAGVQGFTGVEHRLEFVRRVRGADWYNDSIATAPERALAALASFDQPAVLLLGGRDKGLPWDDLLAELHRRVDHVVLFGEFGPELARMLGAPRRGARPESIDLAPGLEGAVLAAAQRAAEGDVVLLAPGGTSFDEFPDFAARGERFRELVRAL
jgi:UDP-N-acetylmuramoylalanine--D-glutamate ligase